MLTPKIIVFLRLYGCFQVYFQVIYYLIFSLRNVSISCLVGHVDNILFVGLSTIGITFDRNQTLDALNRETFNLALGSFVAFILLEMLFFACEELLAIKNSQSSILLGAKFGSSSAKNHKSNNGKYQDGKSILIRIFKRIIQSASRHYRGLIYSFLVQLFCAYRLYSGMSNKSVDGKINRLG